MRTIEAIVIAPCTKIARWLVDEIKKFPAFDSCPKNSFLFAQLIQNINNNEVLVSLDLEALFPSIPKKRALATLKTQLSNQNITEEELSRNKFQLWNRRKQQIGVSRFGIATKKNINIAMHHKPTSILRYVTSNTYAPIQHKLAVLRSLAHRLIKLPLSLENYVNEHNYIEEAA